MAFLLKNRGSRGLSQPAAEPGGPPGTAEPMEDAGPPHSGDGTVTVRSVSRALAIAGVARVVRVPRSSGQEQCLHRVDSVAETPLGGRDALHAHGPARPTAEDLRSVASKFLFWAPQDGAVLHGEYAFDCETTAISEAEPWSMPTFVLGAAFDGTDGWFVEREHLGAFLLSHPDHTIVMHRAVFDLAVIHKAVPNVGVYDRVDQDRVMDTQLLHRLYKLATVGHTAFGKGQTTLDRCIAEYLGIELPKDLQDSRGNDVRTSYGQWLDRSLEEMEPIYMEYLAKDAVVTEWLFRELERWVSNVLAGSSFTWGYVSDEWLAEQQRRWGPLTHHIQLRADIVLNEITRNGLHLDRDRRDQCVHNLQRINAEHLTELRQHDYEPGTGSAGGLQGILRQLDADRPELRLRRTRTGKYKADRQTLAELVDQHPFFKALMAYREVEKLRSAFLDKMDKPVLHPNFDVLKTTGRTSSFGDINAQNLPRDDRVRSCFIPVPGHVFIDADYSTVELATLAQALNDAPGLTVDVDAVETNIIYIDVDPALGTAADFTKRLEQAGVRTLPTAPQRFRAVTHLDVSTNDIERAIEVIRQMLS